jgi:hypothetical protein
MGEPGRSVATFNPSLGGKSGLKLISFVWMVALVK